MCYKNLSEGHMILVGIMTITMIETNLENNLTIKIICCEAKGSRRHPGEACYFKR